MTIPEEDVELVAERTGVEIDLARRALRYVDGDLAAAIAQLADGDIPTQKELTERNRRGVSDIPKEDAELVAVRTDVPLEKARDVLEQTDGDLAVAISRLTQNNSTDQNDTTDASESPTARSTGESTSLYATSTPGSDDSPTKIYSPDTSPSESTKRAAPEYCDQCGTELTPDRASFCPYCGNEIN